MIYLDSAATSFQKPPEVRRAVLQAIETMSSPGRGGYKSAMLAADMVLNCRETLAEYFSVPKAENVVFTSGCTHSLNIAVKSIVPSGDRVVISGYEHNAVLRPLNAIGAVVDVAEGPPFRPDILLRSFAEKLPGAACAVCTHVSNVFGYILPLEEIALMCRQHGVPLIVDAAQSAGCIPISFSGLGCAFAAMPGHKGLLGPQGTGVLLCGEGRTLPLMEGGTGSRSEEREMPWFLPDRLEAGTHNIPGIAGLYAGVQWLRKRGEGAVLAHERKLTERFCGRIEGADGIHVCRDEDGKHQSGVVSVWLENLDCEEAAGLLGERGIAVRAGLHCAPLAHRTAGTLERGTVRFSFSPFNQPHEVILAADALQRIAKKRT